MQDDSKRPDGFGPAVHPHGPFIQRNGLILARTSTAELTEQAFLVEEGHTNSIGSLHGGMVATFMDSVLAHTAFEAASGQLVTLHMNIDFIGMARIGDWVQGEGRVTRATSDVVFTEARAFVGDRDVARAAAIFKRVQPKG